MEVEVFCAPKLRHVVRRLPAGSVRVAVLHLQGDVLDTEAVVHLAGGVAVEAVVRLSPGGR